MGWGRAIKCIAVVYYTSGYVISPNTQTLIFQKVWTSINRLKWVGGERKVCLFRRLLLTLLQQYDIIPIMDEELDLQIEPADEPVVKKTTAIVKGKKGKKFGLRKQGEKGVTANQWTNSPQQNEFLNYYLNPEQSETWGNAYLAATKAGYSDSYASSIMNVAPQWVQQAQNIVKLQPEHLKQALASIASSKYEKASDRIQAIKLLGIDQGMFVQKQLVGHVNIEDALKD